MLEESVGIIVVVFVWRFQNRCGKRKKRSLVVGELFYLRNVGVLLTRLKSEVAWSWYCDMMSGACVGSFLVGVTASCAVAGCARGAQRRRSGFRCVSSFCALCLVYLPFVGSRPCSCCRSERRVNNSVCSCHGCYTPIYPYWSIRPYRKVMYCMYIVLVFYI